MRHFWDHDNERSQLKATMPKGKADKVIQVGQGNLVDAEAMGEKLGFTAQYINRLAAAGKIPWHGVRNGAKVYRRYDQLEVLEALKHEVGISAPQHPKKRNVASRSGRDKELRANITPSP
jgi:hypothetical protein